MTSPLKQLTAEVIERYKLQDGPVDYSVKVTGAFGVGLYYMLQRSSFTIPVQALIYSIEKYLKSNFDNSSYDNIELIHEYRAKLHETIMSKLSEEEEFDQKFCEYIASHIVHKLTGHGDIDLLLLDELIEEVVINDPKRPVMIAHKKYGWLTTNIYFQGAEDVMELIQNIATKRDKAISESSPLLDTALWSGDRVNCTHPIVSVHSYPSVTIRKFSRDPFTVVDFIKNKTASVEFFAVLWQAMQYESNILIVGGTGSGKTSLLNVLNLFNPVRKRILTIEDTPEIRLPDTFENKLNMITQQGNVEGKGAINGEQLLQNSLRQRPDFIILQEIRKMEEAQVGFEAMLTGHSFAATFHANDVEEAIMRLTHAPFNIQPASLQALDLVVVVRRDRKNNKRRVMQIAEISAQQIGTTFRTEAHMIFSYNSRSDTLERSPSSTGYFSDLSEKTGQDRAKLERDVLEKMRILEWLVKHDIRKQEFIAKVLEAYYSNKPDVLAAIDEDRDSL